MLGGDDGVDPSADLEVAHDRHLSGFDGTDQVVQDPVGHVLVEMTLVAKRPQVELQGLQFDAKKVRDVANCEGGEVRLPGLRAQASELGAGEMDLVIPPRLRVGERLQILGWLRTHVFGSPFGKRIEYTERLGDRRDDVGHV